MDQAMRCSLRVRFVGLSLSLLMGTVALADTVLFSDGSRIVGTIERLGDEKVVIATEIAGKLEIDASKIVAMSAERPLTVEFASGDRLVGTVELSDTQDASVMHTSLGDVPIPPGEIRAIWLPGEDSPEVLALREEVEKTRKELTPDWTVKLEAGGIMKEGNSETLDAQGRFDVIRKTKNDLLNFYLAAEYSEQDDKRSKNEYRGGIKYEKMFSERAFWYARVEMEFDEFENLDLRSTAAAGAGYYWLKKPEHEFKNRGGVGYRHESYDNGNSSDEAVLDLGYDYRLDVAPWLQFAHALTYSPGFEEFDDYRLDVDTALLMPLKSDNLKLKLGMRNEYNSRPQGDNERLDNTYYANLLLELKE